MLILNSVLYRLLITEIILQKTLDSTSFLRIGGMLIVLGIDCGRPGPFTKREDDVRRTSWTRERSHSFWIPEDRSCRRSISCHIVSPTNIRESEEDDGCEEGASSFQGLRRQSSSIFRTQLFKNSPASLPSSRIHRRFFSSVFRRILVLFPTRETISAVVT